MTKALIEELRSLAQAPFRTFPFLMYRSAEQNISVNAVIRDKTIWLTRKVTG